MEYQFDMFSFLVGAALSFLIILSVPMIIRYGLLRRPMQNKLMVYVVLGLMFVFFETLSVISRHASDMEMYSKIDLLDASKVPFRLSGIPMLIFALYLSYKILTKKGYVNPNPHVLFDSEELSKISLKIKDGTFERKAFLSRLLERVQRVRSNEADEAIQELHFLFEKRAIESDELKKITEYLKKKSSRER